jgi:SAM-dependent methyltransferase
VISLRARARRLRRRFGKVLDAAGLLGPFHRVRLRWTAARAPEPANGTWNGAPMPPARLRALVGRSADPGQFDAHGRVSVEMIARTLTKVEVDIASLDSILDFGCGCGRVARHLSALVGPELHGCDSNPALVAWCDENLDFMDARVNGPLPPLPYDNHRFDLVYAISVFTHLTAPLATLWLDELVRVLRPRGLLLLTTHGIVFRRLLSAAERGAFDRGELVVQRPRMAGTNACAAFHPRSYGEEWLAGRFESVRFFGDGANRPFRQDVYVATRARSLPSRP